MGQLVVANTQVSCVRFSAFIYEALDSSSNPQRLPQLFHVPDILTIEPFFFVSMRFGDPGYAALSLAAPEALVRGAENTSEMGSFSFLLRPIRFGSIVTKIDEFKPVGVLPQFVFEGESAVIGSAE